EYPPASHIQLRPSSVLFFFSSRRRHTRSLRDWSSDVCSSDLMYGMNPGFLAPLLTGAMIVYPTSLQPSVLAKTFREQRVTMLLRSEERRVGKECRSAGAGCQ